jgi:hypothetical protein
VTALAGYQAQHQAVALVLRSVKRRHHLQQRGRYGGIAILAFHIFITMMETRRSGLRLLWGQPEPREHLAQPFTRKTLNQVITRCN